MLKKIASNNNIRRKVYERIRDYIVSNEILPGGKIDEEALARNLGVSKTPVREALSRLAHDGLVEIVPNRGSFKVKLSGEDIKEIMHIRETLEGLCIRLAIPNIDDKAIGKLEAILNDFSEEDVEKDFLRYADIHSKFHVSIHNLSKSPRLIRILQSAYALTQMIRYQYFSNPESVRRSVQEHRDLLEALKKKDGDLAESLCKRIISSAFESLIRKA